MGDLIALNRLVEQAALVTTQTPDEYAREQSAAMEEKRYKRLEDLEMPDHVRKAIVTGTAQDTAARRAIAGWRELRSSPVLILSGSRGRGKTVAALAEVAECGGLYAGAREFLRVSRSQWQDDVKQMRDWMQCALLVVDDLGRESDAAEMSVALLDVFDLRPSVRKRTILVTNFDKAAFVKRYPDERLRSRMSQLASFVADGSDQDMRRMKP
jgi:chromosomal replication initiation ATPase DnaA